MKFTISISTIVILVLVIVTVSASPLNGNTVFLEKRSGNDENALLSTPENGHSSIPLAHCNTPDLASEANAYLTIENAVFTYEVISSATEPVEEIEISPPIYRVNGNDRSQDVLVFEPEPVVCRDTNSCTASGTFTPVWDIDNSTGMFFVKSIVYFTPYDACDSDGSS